MGAHWDPRLKMKTVCCILIAIALAHATVDEYEVEPVTSAPEVAAEDFYEAATTAEEGRNTFDDDESDFKPQLAQEISKRRAMQSSVTCDPNKAKRQANAKL